MRILLDTHVILWWIRNNMRLGKRTRQLIQSNETLVWVSSVSIWEISIKAALGRLDIKEPFERESQAEMERSGFRPLPVTFDHAFAVRKLPLHHADPFDRMLVAQAQCEDLVLVTA